MTIHAALFAAGMALALSVSGCASRSILPLRPAETYVFLWDCLPGLACYADVLTVVRVLPGGWVEVMDPVGQRWVVNPARAIAITPREAILPPPEPPTEQHQLKGPDAPERPASRAALAR